MAELIYVCCALVSTLCTWLLIKSYRKNKVRVLLWVALGFCFLALNNIFACIDLVLLADMDLWGSLVRNVLLATAGTVLVAGLTWELT